MSQTEHSIRQKRALFRKLPIAALLTLTVSHTTSADVPGQELAAGDLAYDWLTHTSSDAEAVTFVIDPRVLDVLSVQGYSAGEMLGGPRASNAAELYGDPNHPETGSEYYRRLADSVGIPLEHDSNDQLPSRIPERAGDIPDLVRLLRNFEDRGARSTENKTGGYFIRTLANNSYYPYQVEFDGDEPRHFDERWMRSRFAFFTLAAVVNRLDRADFDPASCGEVRFIYRLNYRTRTAGSSMPFFINVVYAYPRKDCTKYAKRWLIDPALSEELRSKGDRAPAAFAAWVRAAVADLQFKQIELNYQALRFTSGYMHDLGGQALYFQRIFRPGAGGLAPVALENTPDVLAIEKNPVLFEKFIQFLRRKENLAKLDQGTLNIDFDREFLATFSASWSTLGRARTANKPYSRLFEKHPGALESLDISGLKTIRSREALVERLNNLTCMGCHQSGGTAGFHMLGLARDEYSHHFNRQELPYSPHVYAEHFRRREYTLALAAGRTPDSYRPHSNTAPNGSHSAGQLCLLDKKHFAGNPECGAGFKCENTTGGKHTLFGECIKQTNPPAGSVCWKGEISEVASQPAGRGVIPSFNYFAFQDKWRMTGAAPRSPAQFCVLPKTGAPLGRSSRRCSPGEESFQGMTLAKGRIPDEICANQGGSGFDGCAAASNSGACLEAGVSRAMLDTCYPGKFCREDYICQRLPDYHRIAESSYASGKNQTTPSRISAQFIEAAHRSHIGFCVPTYFLFNMRVDGHPSPVTGLPPANPVIRRDRPLRGYSR